jgi:hypothetical protein
LKRFGSQLGAFFYEVMGDEGRDVEVRSNSWVRRWMMTVGDCSVLFIPLEEWSKLFEEIQAL